MKRYSQEEFIKKCEEVHSGKYDYSQTVFNGVSNKIKIICPIHGEFEQVAAYHVAGHGCRKCAGTNPLTTEEFIKRAKEKHGNKYDYSKSVYTDAKTKVCIICPEHGEFWQMPIQHMNGYGCPKCAGKNNNTDDFINRAKKVHGNKYDYSKVEYVDSKTPVTIICPKHGEFCQAPVKHLIGHGCPKCGIENRVKKQFLSQDDFISRAREVHGDKYNYSKVAYKSMRDKICIICPKHGEFWQTPVDHINEHGCPKCGQLMSKAEDDIYSFIKKYLDDCDIIKNNREVLNGKEIDIYIPSRNVGIEYNGLKWHSEEFGKGFDYHLGKSVEALKKGINLIQVFEDEFVKNRTIVLSRIKEALNMSCDTIKVSLDECTIYEISKDSYSEFSSKYDILPYGKCTKVYGCFHGDELIGVMSFLQKNNKIDWEVVRAIINNKYKCDGMFELLFNTFISNNNVSKVTAFSDRRWVPNFSDSIYLKCGFRFMCATKPDYCYVNMQSPNDRIKKSELRKRSLRKSYGLSMKDGEKFVASKIGLSKIWNCGMYKYTWKNGAV